ncbi:DUF427 domain-containing protein [Mesorhizobium sp. B2-2-4]|nr:MULTISPECIES: DUF427 domain-containing protein [unclassified Mesorhizobium]MBZ9699618.1 DUF427 domain-containing protein [Mesorhizobium sp. CO1-1-3]MBZ9893895.1 DUF427 domain-containing protein [Mesorhizobium sp. BR1-1-6]MBZ9918655.1 DUF427 domain-containing protein [Mesorhizobium sp. BR1-1-7]MBZ9945870.1 DUF427 domain-containing protein [Mesorhizobium sp. BR1-1-11]MBZ9952148.1 DUF427 domain-containing protein [Mesorhizobium sp. BR1-1-15]MBZ9959068.1 DUF427 domain-containing protein [Mesor
MNPSAEPRSPSGNNLHIQPFHGTVTVRFSDAIIASTEHALQVQETGRDPVFYIPFQDIYFDLLEKTDTTSISPKGTASYWRVHAVGGSADDFMWAYEEPEAPVRVLARHAAFDPGKARIDADPAEDERHTPHIVE